MATKKSNRTKVTLYSGEEVTIYAGSRVQAALAEVSEDMNLYKGVRLSQLLEAVYEQGKKDGARAAFEVVTNGIADAQKQIPHRKPGRPRKSATAKKSPKKRARKRT